MTIPAGAARFSGFASLYAAARPCLPPPDPVCRNTLFACYCAMPPVLGRDTLPGW